MDKITNNPKLLECLFGHHDFFTQEGCIRQCVRCRIIQLFMSSGGWCTAELEDAEDFDLETMTKFQMSSEINDLYQWQRMISITDIHNAQHRSPGKRIRYWASGDGKHYNIISCKWDILE